MVNKDKAYWAVIGDGFGPVSFHYLKDAKKCYNECIKNHISAPELYRINQKIITNGKWKRL